MSHHHSREYPLTTAQWAPWACAIVGAWLVGFLMGGGGSSEGGKKPVSASETPAPADLATPKVTTRFRGQEMSSAKLPPTDAIRIALAEPSAMRRTQAFAAAIGALSVEEIRELIPLLGDLPINDAAEVGGMLFGRWAELDSGEAAAQALAQTDSSRRRYAVSGALATWASSDPDAASAWVDSLPAGPDRDAYSGDLVGMIGRSDPQAAFRRLLENPLLDQSGNYYEMQNVVARWAEHDPRGAIAAISQIKQERLREWVTTAAARMWARHDPPAAWGWALGLVDGREKTAAIQAAATALAERDSDEALRKIMGMPAGADQQRAAVAVTGVIAQTDPQHALSIADRLQPPADQLARAAIVQAVAPTNLELAMSLVGKMDAQMREMNLPVVIPILAQRDPASAMSMLADPATEPSFADRQTGQTLSRWMQTKPDDALRWLANHELPNRDNYFATTALAQWANTNVGPARAWLEKAGDKPSSQLVLNGFLQGIATDDPPLAAKLAESQIGKGVSPQTLGTISKSWVEKDTPGALKWISNLPEGDARLKASAMTVGMWARSNPAEAAAWIEKLPAGDLRDGSSTGYVMSVSETDPAGAAARAVTIQNPKAQAEALEYALLRWMRRDRAAAESWISQNESVPEGIRRRFVPPSR